MPPQNSLKMVAPSSTDQNGDVTNKEGKMESEKKTTMESMRNWEPEEWNYWDHILWPNVFWFTLLHLTAVYGLYVAVTQASIATSVFSKFSKSSAFVRCV